LLSSGTSPLQVEDLGEPKRFEIELTPEALQEAEHRLEQRIGG